METVHFSSHGCQLVGHLHLPDNLPRQPLPAVVITGAWTTVKEQMAGRYAREMANRGFAALAFDFRNWGESKGDNRQLEDPTLKTEDIMAAAAYLANRSDIDPQQIFGIGICASAGYMVNAAIQSPHIKAITLIAPWLHNREIVDAVYGGEDQVASLIATAQQAAKKFAATGELTMLPAASTTDESAVMYQAPYYTETDRGMIPEWRNEFNVASWKGWLTFDAIALAKQLHKPILITHSEAAAIPQGAHQFYEKLTCPKQAIWLDNVTQFDFYDQDKVVKQACDATMNYLNER